MLELSKSEVDMNLLKEHNRELYEQMNSYLKTEKKVCVVLGTGLGKTTTALQYLYDNWIRGLVIVPNNTVKKSWNNPICECVTYSYFMKNYRTIDYSIYGLIVLDEAHHIGADKWGEGIRWLLDTQFIPILGLTATPTRTDMIDIREYFGNNICEGLDVFTGIKKGILYPFSYVGAYYDANEIVSQAHEHYAKLDTELKGLLDIALNNTPPVKQIILNHMPSGHRKGIVFVSRIKEVEEAKKLILSIYPEAKVQILHSKMTTSDVEKTTEWFYKTPEGYLITVSMMGEGAHFPGVNTLIMLRKTTSNLIFTQQLGRCLTLTDEEKDGQSVVFDLVNNSNNLKNFYRKYNQILRERKKGRGETVYSDQLILKCYTSEIDDILERINNLYGYGWNEEQIGLLKKYYPTQGTNIPELLKSKSARNIYRYAVRLGLQSTKVHTMKRVSAEDKAIIKEFYPIEGTKCISRLNCPRSETYVSKLAAKMGLNFFQGRKVRCVETGKEYSCAPEAARDLGTVSGRRILRCAKHDYGCVTAGGFHWEFVEE